MSNHDSQKRKAGEEEKEKELREGLYDLGQD
jgi:hypothetical protein